MSSSADDDASRSKQRRRPVPAAVVALCRNETPALPQDATTQRLFLESVRHHRIAPLAHVMLRSTDPALAAKLKDDRDATVTRHISASVVLDGLGELLDGVRWAVFKGPVLSEHAHPARGLRTYHDVDVLVSPRDLREVTSRLSDAGWRVADYVDMLCNPDTPGEMHWVSPNGMLIDLHWSMINMAPTRRLFAIRTEELLERRVPVSIGLSSAWTLDPTDSVAHVCLHAALTGAHRMLLLLDADQLARHVTDWDDVVARAHSWSAAPALAIVLGRARALLGTPLPDGLNHELDVSASFRLFTGTVDRLMPVPTLRSDSSLPRLVARSARSHSAGTLAAVGRRSLQGLTERLSVTRPASPPANREPADLDALETYLRAVESYASQDA